MDKSLLKYIEKYKRELKALENEREMLHTQMMERRGVNDIAYYGEQIALLDGKIQFWKTAFVGNAIDV